MKEISNQELSRFTNIIISVTNSVVEQTSGVAAVNGAIKYRFGLKARKNGSIHVYYKQDNSVVIDLFINMVYGYSVPEVISTMQENVKREVEIATKFSVESVNVNISNVIFK